MTFEDKIGDERDFVILRYEGSQLYRRFFAPLRMTKSWNLYFTLFDSFAGFQIKKYLT
jgi:hypothetical protein